MGRKSDNADEFDPLVDSVWVGKSMGVTSEYGLRLMRAGEFGPVFDIGTGEHRARLRVRRSGVEAWLASREMKRVPA